MIAHLVDGAYELFRHSYGLLVMSVLAAAKLRVARTMGSKALRADAMETWVCAYLSAALLVGLALNASLGWWWAVAVAGLAITGMPASSAGASFSSKPQQGKLKALI